MLLHLAGCDSLKHILRLLQLPGLSEEDLLLLFPVRFVHTLCREKERPKSRHVKRDVERKALDRIAAQDLPVSGSDADDDPDSPAVAMDVVGEQFVVTSVDGLGPSDRHVLLDGRDRRLNLCCELRRISGVSLADHVRGELVSQRYE